MNVLNNIVTGTENTRWWWW